MSRRASQALSGTRPDLRTLAVAALAMAIATGVAALMVQALMAPSLSDLAELCLYLVGSGILTLILGRFILDRADRSFGLDLRAKSFVSAAVGSGVALLNVFIVAQLMFFSTDHDLPLLMALLVFAAIITVLLAQWVAASVATGVHRLAEAARALSNGDYGVRVAVTSRDEVGDLTATFNEMARRLEEAERIRADLDRERRQLTMAISHDLRTPLASLRVMVEALNDQVVAEPDEIRRYHRTMLRELQHLSSLIDDLFDLAQIDGGALRLNVEDVMLESIATEAVDAMRPRARRKRVELTLTAEEPLPLLSVDSARISRVLLNLLENALSHTPADGQISVTLGRSGSNALLKVADNGEGIPSKDLPHIWTPFYRGEESRRRVGNGDGTGLGLAIVKGIVEAHGGSVAASSEPGEGTEIRIALPCV